MSYLQCPECRLTVPASAYYLRGDECPRCLTPMEPCAGLARKAAERETTAPPRLFTRDAGRAGDPRLNA